MAPETKPGSSRADGAGWRVGIDVGGTFTDLFGWDETSGRQVTAKVLTTRSDRSRGVLEAVEKAGIPFDGIAHLIHGTTTATNAVLERSYPDAAMVTTAGFRDTIEIGRQHRKYLYDPYQTKPKPIIRRRYRFALDERMSVAGETVRPLDEDAARTIARRIADAGIQSVAVAFLNSYVNPAHERRMREILREHLPHAYVVLSSETRPVFREHGRFVTTAIRAAIMPVMVEYFDRLAEGLGRAGFKGSLLILKSSGGVMGVELAKQRPEELLESGPAGGVSYAGHLSRIASLPRIVHTDMGGTSYDASIVEDGKGLVTRSYELEWELPLVVPMLDIHSVGAGGGSIGWIDEGGSLRVGPRSAGSDPGPACYGRGGVEPTITDANLLLGRLEPSLGSKFPLDRAAAERAVESLASQVGLSTLETAEGMIRICSESMAQAVSGVLLARGRDPRDFVLASFGGAGPMHACFVARAMNIPRVLVPAFAGVASAFGATAMSLRQDLEAFLYAPISQVQVERLNEALEELERGARSLLAQDGIAGEAMGFVRTAQMRYVGQTYEVETPLPDGRLTASSLEDVTRAFHERHALEYGVSSDVFEPAFVSVGVTGIGRLGAPPVVQRRVTAGRDARREPRPVYFDGTWIDTAVYDGDALAAGTEIAGPAIVEYADTCAVLPPGASAVVDDTDNLVITVGA
ncbi:MAG TPA: hydantoinase/oxoprolinase family protein [Myxococcota bacterium]|nr:hydantoinase/oxoprolinase family protein [Myxococcota bacterium]